MAPTSTAKLQAARSSPRASPEASHPPQGSPAYMKFVEMIDKVADRKIRFLLANNRVKLVNYNLRGSCTQWKPRLDVFDDPASPTIVASFELPGVSRNEISLNIQDGHLVVEGERRNRLNPVRDTPLPRHPVAIANALASGEMDVDSEQHSAPRPRHLIEELRYGKFKRAIPLPEGTKESDITATLTEGMLTVTWPRGTYRQPKGSADASAEAAYDGLQRTAVSTPGN